MPIKTIVREPIRKGLATITYIILENPDPLALRIHSQETIGIEWEPAHLPIEINRREEDLFKRFYPVEKIRPPLSVDLYSRSSLVRTDSGLWLAYYRFLSDWRKFVLRPLRAFQSRLFWTLLVWELVPSLHPFEIPSWPKLD